MNPAIKRIWLTGTALILLGSGPLSAQSTLTPEQLTLRVERLTELSQRSEAKLSTAQDQLKTLSDEMGRMGRLVDNRAMLEMIQQVDQISEDINLLRGEIEVQGNDIVEIKKRQRELYKDIDRRLRDMESRTLGLAPVAAGTAPPVSTQSQSTGTTAGTGSQTPSLAPSTDTSAAAAAAAASTSAAVSAPQAGEKEAYQAAFDTLKEGRYKEAKVELQGFLDKYPTSSFAGNAQYWLGEAHYVTRNFKQGIIEFEKVLNSFPSSSKVPDAMLKLGYTYYELKQYPQSKTVLQDLRTRFPDETAARLASKRLDRIRKEGH
jgi:tol-pal system protein YbgF